MLYFICIIHFFCHPQIITYWIFGWVEYLANIDSVSTLISLLRYFGTMDPFRLLLLLLLLVDFDSYFGKVSIIDFGLLAFQTFLLSGLCICVYKLSNYSLKACGILLFNFYSFSPNQMKNDQREFTDTDSHAQYK